MGHLKPIIFTIMRWIPNGSGAFVVSLYELDQMVRMQIERAKVRLILDNIVQRLVLKIVFGQVVSHMIIQEGHQCPQNAPCYLVFGLTC